MRVDGEGAGAEKLKYDEQIAAYMKEHGRLPPSGTSGKQEAKESEQVESHCAKTWRMVPGRPAQGVSEARAAVRGRQETD